MLRSLEPLLLRQRRPPMAAGVAVSLASVAVATALIYPLKQAAPVVSLGVVYLLGVLLLSAAWGLALGVLTSVASTIAFNFFHLPPEGRVTLADDRDWVVLAALLAVALAVSTVAEAARSRAIEADERRDEADLAAELTVVLLGGDSLQDARALAAHRLAEATGIASASIELGFVEPGPRRSAIALRDGDAQIGTLIVPAELAPAQTARLRERIVPALASIMAAALARQRLQAEVVETASLRRSDELKTALLRSVSHDLRTPLTAILTGAVALRSATMDEAERDEVAAGIVDDATRLSRLIDKLLDLSRLQSGTAAPQPTWCAIDEVLREAVAHVADPEAEFSFVIDGDLPLVRADAVQLERAFANLIENAVRYGRGMPVSVRARAVGQRLLVRIVDRGPGIVAAEQERVFAPFYRSGHGGDHRGSGLGLAIAKGFVEMNGGQISVESLPGQGASFVISLPLEPIAGEAATTSTTAAP